jgi:hypothetical protein
MTTVTLDNLILLDVDKAHPDIMRVAFYSCHDPKTELDLSVKTFSSDEIQATSEEGDTKEANQVSLSLAKNGFLKTVEGTNFVLNLPGATFTVTSRVQSLIVTSSNKGLSNAKFTISQSEGSVFHVESLHADNVDVLMDRKKSMEPVRIKTMRGNASFIVEKDLSAGNVTVGGHSSLGPITITPTK